MEMTQRGKLEPHEEFILTGTLREMRKAEVVRDMHRLAIVEMVDKSSFREVSRLTGISTTTLQRWKREAGK